ncbi:MAG: deoxynucleoside kinase [Roseiflexaceae bacterium]
MHTHHTSRHIHISVAGNIGVGKSTLVSILAEELRWQPYYELVADHPYLDDYYNDRARWGFHSQIWFLTQRYEQHLEISDTPGSVIEDRSMYEDYEIFVKGLFEEGILSQRDFRTYRRLYNTLVQRIQPPTLVIYLQASVETLQTRIRERARPSEMNIPEAYLRRLNARYDDWMRRFERCPVLHVPTDNLDFAHTVAGRKEIVDMIMRAVGIRGITQERLLT